MMSDDGNGGAAKPAANFLGSLRDALAAASRDEDTRTGKPEHVTQMAAPADVQQAAAGPAASSDKGAVPSDDGAPPPLPSAADAAREARAGTPNIPPVDRHVEFGAPPTTRVVREPQPAAEEEDARTQLVRGKQQVERGTFEQDPVVGWLVIVGGPGLGAYRPIFEGNNTVGRSTSNRVPIDFGDDAISGEEQAYIRYDSADRSFLLVPNLSKTNVVSLNETRPTSAEPLQAMDVITMGRTQLVFVPFCGKEFDWAELTELKS